VTAPSNTLKNNPYAGTWRLVSAVLTKDDSSQPAFGERPLGLLSFNENMHYVEVLMDGDVPHVASGQIGGGTAEENAGIAARTIGMFGTYSVDEDGNFTGDQVEGSTFPNWIGDVRTRKDISVRVEGDRMDETFHQPGGATINLVWQRVS
jgi:hypothetical protein